MSNLIDALAEIVGEPHARSGADAGDDFSHDEALGATWVDPDCVVFPASTAEVAKVMAAGPSALKLSASSLRIEVRFMKSSTPRPEAKRALRAVGRTWFGPAT